MKVLVFITILFINISPNVFSISETNYKENLEPLKFKEYSNSFFKLLKDSSLNYSAFEIALKGYFELKNQNRLNNDRYLTIIDMSVSSNKERFYLIDMYSKHIVYKSLVAHGVSTGREFAKHFSNIKNSYKTSLGFYLTGETYNGKHNFSLKLDGLEQTNNNARDRGIVIHAANYVSQDFIKSNGRLGRSHGCPALPFKNYFDIISKIKNKSCLFIYYPSNNYSITFTT